MDVVLLSRLQFAFTIGFHYIFPLLTIGMGVVLVYLEAQHLRSFNQHRDESPREALILPEGTGYYISRNWMTRHQGPHPIRDRSASGCCE